MKREASWMRHERKGVEILLQNKVALLGVIGYDVSG
jgi:hypothetical protein